MSAAIAETGRGELSPRDGMRNVGPAGWIQSPACREAVRRAETIESPRPVPSSPSSKDGSRQRWRRSRSCGSAIAHPKTASLPSRAARAQCNRFRHRVDGIEIRLSAPPESGLLSRTRATLSSPPSRRLSLRWPAFGSATSARAVKPLVGRSWPDRQRKFFIVLAAVELTQSTDDVGGVLGRSAKHSRQRAPRLCHSAACRFQEQLVNRE